VTLKLRAVVKHYPTQGEVIKAVDGVSLTVDPGEVVAIYGPSGSGKTTLLLLAAAMLAPDAGSVMVDGRDLAALSEKEASRYRLEQLGFVFQSFHLNSSASVRDNAATKLLLGGLSPAAAHRRVTPWLERLGLGDRLTASAGRLSAGERQRIAIARALSNDPRLLLADEPTGNLDAERGGEVLALLRELARQRDMAVLLVTHDPGAIEWVDRAFVLRDGHLGELADDRPLARILTGQA
jgi:putative ABC transport system ATP-binding protein